MLGHSQFRTLPLIQIADLAGVYGITLLIVLANIVLYRALRAVSGAGVPYPVKSAVVLLLLLIGTLFYGFSRLNEPETAHSKPLRVALIQGNIPQDVKWSPAFREHTVDTYERLTRDASKGGVDLIVWPESAVPFFFQDEPLQAERIRSLAREMNACLLFGSPAHELRNGKKHLSEQRLYAVTTWRDDRTGRQAASGAVWGIRTARKYPDLHQQDSWSASAISFPASGPLPWMHGGAQTRGSGLL